MTSVLVVDDNIALAYFTVRSLQKDIHGVEVVMASSCREARAKSHLLSPSVVIADMKLPDGDGLDLVQEFVKQFPGIKAIVTSGTEVPQAGTANLFGALKKPYGEESLVNMVRHALGLKGSMGSRNSGDRRVRERPVRSLTHNGHYVRNRFSAFLAGMRVLQEDLKADAHDPSAVRRIAEVDIERLFEIATELANLTKQIDKGRRDVDD